MAAERSSPCACWSRSQNGLEALDAALDAAAGAESCPSGHTPPQRQEPGLFGGNLLVSVLLIYKREAVHRFRGFLLRGFP